MERDGGHEVVGDRQTAFGELDRGLEQLRPGEDAEAVMGGVKPGHGSRDACGQVADLVRPPDDRRRAEVVRPTGTIEGEHGCRRPPWRPDPVVDGVELVALGQIDGHVPVAAQAAHLWFDDKGDEGGGNRRIDRIAPRLQHRRSGDGLAKVAGAERATGRGDLRAGVASLTRNHGAAPRWRRSVQISGSIQLAHPPLKGCPGREQPRLTLHVCKYMLTVSDD